jgi:hypothetical protein
VIFIRVNVELTFSLPIASPRLNMFAWPAVTSAQLMGRSRDSENREHRDASAFRDVRGEHVSWQAKGS